MYYDYLKQQHDKINTDRGVERFIHILETIDQFETTYSISLDGELAGFFRTKFISSAWELQKAGNLDGLRALIDAPRPFNYDAAKLARPFLIAFKDSPEDLVRSIVYASEDLQREVGKLRWRFMTSSEAFIHGDLHTGSIFMRADDIKLFDSEFAFFGPAGYDLGNVLAHLLFARAHARYTGDDACASWVEAQLGQLVETFAHHLAGASIPDETDPFAPALEPWVLRNVLSDAAGYCGTELLRRVVGVAKVRDLTTLEPVVRAEAERELLTQAVDLVLNRTEYTDPNSFEALIA